MADKTAFDPRQPLREALCDETYRYEGDDEILAYTLEVTDNEGDPVNVPLYLTEEIKSNQLPNFPFLELSLEVTYEPHDIMAATRKVEANITIHIYYTDTDNISAKDFGKKIKDKLHNTIRAAQSTTTGIAFMNVEYDNVERESDGRQVIFHYTAILYCLYYDLC